MDEDLTRRATGDLDDDGAVSDRDELPPSLPPGDNMTIGEIGAAGGGSPAAQAAARERERTGQPDPDEVPDGPDGPERR